MLSTKKDIVARLQKDILLWQGFKPAQAGSAIRFGLGPVEEVFPNGIFPTGTIHEFLTVTPEDAAASGGFIGGLLKTLMQHGGACIWISLSRKLFPPALKIFGVEPEQVIFVDVKRERDMLWATEEALKCEGLAAVIVELRELSFAQSRRLQLAVEKSKVTGFVLRNDAGKLSSTACVARWRISSIPSELEEGMPGVGFPRWNIELLKVRNGKPGAWQLEWFKGEFKLITETYTEATLQKYA